MVGSITFGGLISGIDTDSIVKAIVDSRRYQVKSVQDKIARVGELKGTLRLANTQLLELQQRSLQLRLENTFLSKKVTISNPAVASATASFDAIPRKSVLTIAQLARGAQASSGLGNRALERAAAVLVQGNTANFSAVNVGATQLGGTRAIATDLLTQTLQAGRGSSAVTAGDMVTITGTRKSGAAVNATFTFAGNATDTVQRLASAVQSAFGGDITVTVGTSGQLVLSEADTAIAGDFTLSALTFSDADLSGSAFDVGLGPAQASGGPVANELTSAVTFTTGDSAALATAATLLNDLDQLTGGDLEDGLDGVTINLIAPDGSVTATNYTYAAGDTLGDLLAEVNTAFGGDAVATVVNGRIVVTDTATGVSETGLGLTFTNAGTTTHTLEFGAFAETITGATETRQVAHTTAFEVPAKGRYDIATSNGKAGTLTGTVAVNGTDLLGSFAGLTVFNGLTIDRDTGTAGAAPLGILGLNARSTVQDLVDLVNATNPNVTASLVDDGAGAFNLQLSANEGGQELRVLDVAGGILDTLFDPTVGVDTDITTANSTTDDDDVTAVATFTADHGGPAIRVAVSQDDGSALEGLIPEISLSGFSNHSFSPGAAVIRTIESSELNVRPATAPVVFGSAGIANDSLETPPLNVFGSLATAGFDATVESAAQNSADHTDGTFTINGKIITIPSVNTTVQEVLGLINASGAGVIASYDQANDRVILQGATAGSGGITLGGAGDTSNFLRIAGLTEAAGGVALVGNDPGTVDDSTTLAAAGFTITPSSGTFTINGVMITVDTGTDTMATLLSKINNSAAGVEAAYDSNQDRVTLTQKLDDGVTANTISVGNPSDTSNILAAFRLTDSPSTTTQIGTTRQEAIFTVDGVTYNRATNVIEDVMAGVELSLQAVTTDPVTIDIANDSEKALTGIRDFVVSYNKTMKLLNPKPLNDDERDKMQPLTDAEKAEMDFFAIQDYDTERALLQQRDMLFQDSTVRRAVAQLRRQLFDPVTGAAADLDRLTSMGLGTGAAGAGAQDPQVQSGFLVLDSEDPDETLAVLSGNADLMKLLRDRAKDVHNLFGKSLESSAKVTGSLSVTTGVTLTSRLEFAVGDSTRTGTVTLEAGSYTSSELLNAIQDALNTAGLGSDITVKIASGGRLELGRLESKGRAQITVQELSNSGELGSLLGLASGTVTGPQAEEAAGLARRLEAGMKDYTGLGGFLQTQVTAGGVLDDRLADLGEELADAEARLGEFEARTRLQFIALEKAMASFQSTRQFLDQRFAQLNAAK